MNLDNWFDNLPQKWDAEKIRNITFYSPQSIPVEQLKNKKFYYYDIPHVQKFGVGRQEEGSNIDSNKFRLRGGEILISKLNPRKGTVVLTEGNELEIICSTEFVPLKASTVLNDKFLYYILSSKKVANYLNKFVKSVTRSHQRVNPQDILNMRIPVPGKDVQNKIVFYLDFKLSNLQKLILNKEHIIKLLEKQRQSIITEAVTKGLNPNVKMKDSGVEWIGEIPEHWQKTRIDFISRVKARLGWKGLKAEEYVEEGYGFLSTPNLKYREIDFENINYITEERYLESPEIMLEIGDVLLAKDGSTLGIVNVVRDLPIQSTVNSSIAVLRPTNKINSVYYYYYLKSTYIQDVINQIKDGMGVPHLFQADIKKFTVLLPPLTEQQNIAKFLDEETSKIEKLVTNVKSQIEKLKEYRQALIYEVVTGKIDVRDMELN